jgi:lathosterol oxidase
VDWTGWLILVALSTLGGMVIYATVTSYYHVRYYVLRRHEPETWKCQPKRFPRPGHQRDAILSSLGNLVIAGLITGTLIHSMTKGFEPPIYFGVAKHGWLYALLSTALLFVLTDGLAYYVHRAFHQRTMFRLFHRFHHRYVATSPFVVLAIHPVEFISLQAATFIPLFVIPFHYVSIIVVFVYHFVFNIVDHSGVRLESRIPWQGPSTFHDDHHAHFHCNFGQHLTLFDRLHGTLRRAGRRYGQDVFGGKGEPDDGALDGDFVGY